MEEKQTFQQITVTPIRDDDEAPYRYPSNVDGFPPHMWTEPGIYNTPEEVVASSPSAAARRVPARDDADTPGRQAEVTFSLKDAYASV